MKGKIAKKITALAIAATLAMPSLFSCDGATENLTGNAEIWSTYNTLKVMRNSQDYPKLGAELTVDMAIGETEGAQLIYTPETNVKSFRLTAGELKSGDNVFNPENVQIFVQKYLEIKLKTAQQKNEKYPEGWTPDFLLPMETSEKYGENHSDAGNNQGFWVEFTADENTVPGTYTGEFTLSINDVETKIPVSVNVRNVTIAHSYGKNCWGLYQNMLLNGELDSSDEMYETYYSWLLKEYKVCLMHVPYALELDKFAASVMKYYDEPAFTSYGIPTFGTAANGGFFDKNAFNEFVYEIAKNCTPEKMYLDKAYVYPLMADEPSNSTKRRLVGEVKETCENLQYVIIDRLDEIGFFDDYGGKDGEFAQEMTQVLRDFPCVITTAEIGEFGDEVETYCPTVEYFATEYMRELYQEHADRFSGETWFYTAMNPLYPYPSNHIDDYLIGFRSMRWMQMSWGLEGYLNWNIAYYTESADNYNDPSRFFHYGAPFNGDGFMIYPAAKYGGETPYPALRLVSYRDGQEDYDLLRTCEDLLQENYGDAIDVNEMFASSYESVFAGAIYNPDDESFLAERKSLLQRAEALSSETALAAYKTIKDGKETLVVYAKSGSDIYVNGEKVAVSSENGYVHYEQTLTGNVTVQAVNGVDSASVQISTGRTQNGVTLSSDTLGMTNGSTVKLEEDALKLDIQGNISTFNSAITFKPGFTISPSAIGGDLSALESLILTFDNPTEETYAVTVELPLKDGTNITLEKFNMKPGVNVVRITGITLQYAHKKSTPERLRLIFPNYKSEGIKIEQLKPDNYDPSQLKAGQYALTLNSIVYTIKEK